MQNPNATKNRVPTNMELTSLRVIASRKGELLNSIEIQLSDAEVTYDEIMARHERQLALLESIQSELYAAKQHKNTLKSQKRILSDEMDEIRAVLHPIRRLPVETLRHIFEATLEASDKIELWQATQLSHVCQHWRAVALRSPELWSHITVNFRKSLKAITNHWNRAVERVKRAPAHIMFYNLGGKPKDDSTEEEHTEEQRKKVAACSFRRIPVIRDLYIEAAPQYPTLQAFSLITEFPTGDLDSFTLSGENEENRPLEVMSWESSAFIRRLPRSRLLNLKHLNMRYFSPSQPFSILKELSIESVWQFEPCKFLSLCPKLERLTMSFCQEGYSNPQNNAPITIPTLTFLQIEGNNGFAWEASMHFPSLKKIVFSTFIGDPRDDFYDFLGNHPSVRNVELYTDGVDFARLAIAAPQLTNLTLHCSDACPLKEILDWESTPTQGPPFPQLETLDISLEAYYRPTGLELRHFNRFIQTRCLPATHEMSQLANGCHPLRQLRTSLHKTLAKSQFIAEATCVEVGSTVTLSWL